MRRPGRAAVFSVATLTGCVLLTDLGGYNVPVATVDGGGALEDGAAGDTSTPTGDAGVMPTIPDADAGPTGCKSSDAAFCADFDDGTFTGKWTTTSTTAGELIEVSNAVSVSPKFSLHSVIDRAAIMPVPGDCSYARPSRVLSDLGGRSRATFSMDVWLGAPGGPIVTRQLLVGAISTSNGCRFIVGLSNTNCVVLAQDALSIGNDELLPIPIGKSWVHLDLVVSFTPTDPTLNLYVNGKACGAPLTTPATCLGTPTLTVFPGLYCVDKGTGIDEIFIDNVEVR